jgi:tetratricopeptide (TPR) repeat protein
MAQRLNSRPPAAWVATQLTWISRQLLLVPEAVLLLTLLCLHSVLGAPPLLAVLGIAITLYFALRTAFITLGQRALAGADYGRAARLAQAAIAMYPGSADAHALAGSVHLARGQSEQGVAAFRRAVACYPLQADLHTALSAALLDNGQPQEAREEARRALALEPRSAAAHLHLAGAEEQLGASKERVEAVLRAGLACEAPPADEATLRCALAALLAGAGRAAEAQLALAGTERLLASCPAPQRAGLHFHLGELLQASGYVEAARSHFSASERLDPHGRFAAAAWRAARW